MEVTIYCWKVILTDTQEMNTNQNAAVAGNGIFLTNYLFSAFLACYIIAISEFLLLTVGTLSRTT